MAIFIAIPKGDLALDEYRTFTFVQEVPLIRQRLSSRFKFFLGEYFLDLRQGIPYYRDVFLKHPDLDVVRTLFRKVILSTPGVQTLASFNLAYDDSARLLTFDFQAVVEGGVIVVTPDDDDFIVDFSTLGVAA